MKFRFISFIWSCSILVATASWAATEDAGAAASTNSSTSTPPPTAKADPRSGISSQQYFHDQAGWSQEQERPQTQAELQNFLSTKAKAIPYSAQVASGLLGIYRTQRELRKLATPFLTRAARRSMLRLVGRAAALRQFALTLGMALPSALSSASAAAKDTRATLKEALSPLPPTPMHQTKPHQLTQDVPTHQEYKYTPQPQAAAPITVGKYELWTVPREVAGHYEDPDAETVVAVPDPYAKLPSSHNAYAYGQTQQPYGVVEEVEVGADYSLNVPKRLPRPDFPRRERRIRQRLRMEPTGMWEMLHGMVRESLLEGTS